MFVCLKGNKFSFFFLAQYVHPFIYDVNRRAILAHTHMLIYDFLSLSYRKLNNKIDVEREALWSVVLFIL